MFKDQNATTVFVLFMGIVANLIRTLALTYYDLYKADIV